MKHNKWVFFYTLTLFTLLFFTLYLAGIVNINIPTIKIFEKSPDATATKLSALCELDKYEAVATRCVKGGEESYTRITKSDLDYYSNNPVEAVNYVGLARDLCGMITVGRRIDRTQVSATVWDYKYYVSVLFNAGRVYRIVYLDNDWRFVLSK